MKTLVLNAGRTGSNVILRLLDPTLKSFCSIVNEDTVNWANPRLYHSHSTDHLLPALLNNYQVFFSWRKDIVSQVRSRCKVDAIEQILGRSIWNNISQDSNNKLSKIKKVSINLDSYRSYYRNLFEFYSSYNFLLSQLHIYNKSKNDIVEIEYSDLPFDNVVGIDKMPAISINNVKDLLIIDKEYSKINSLIESLSSDISALR